MANLHAFCAEHLLQSNICCQLWFLISYKKYETRIIHVLLLSLAPYCHSVE